MLLTLFRLLDLNAGDIKVDGIDISKIPQNLLRERLIAVPQEPVLFPGTLRFNTVPPNLPLSCQPDDQTIIGAIEKSELLDRRRLLQLRFGC